MALQFNDGIHAGHLSLAVDYTYAHSYILQAIIELPTKEPYKFCGLAMLQVSTVKVLMQR